MDASFGLETALWYADGPDDAREEPTFRRPRSHDYVAREVKAVREAVGAVDIANFANHEVTGPGARAFLDHVLAGRIPKPGRLNLTPMLSPKGKLAGDLTVACLDEERFLLFGSGAMQEAHRRWFEQHLPDHGVTYRNRSDDFHGFGISGPDSRELLSRLTRMDVSAEAFRFRDIRETFVAGVPALLARVSFSGELGYEIHVAPPYLLRLFEGLEEQGADLGLTLYGMRALMSLRLEKSWGAWTLEYRPDFTAAQSGLDAFIDWGSDFIGKAAAQQEAERGPDNKLVTMVVETQEDIDPGGDEAILRDGEAVGYVTSGGYAHYVGKPVALGYLPVDIAQAGERVEIEINGVFCPATVQGEPLYDPKGGRMRS